MERPFRYIREDFFLARTFRDMDGLNTQFADWLATVANARCHGTTRRVVAEAFAEEQQQLGPFPAIPFNAVLSLQRRVSHDGMVSVNGNRYSVPDYTRRRVVEVQTRADEVRIYEGSQLLAVHPVLEGRGQSCLAAGHRRWPPPGTRGKRSCDLVRLPPPGQRVTRRDLGVYDRIGQALAGAEAR